MKACPTCKNNYPDDANFCPQETCATDEGPTRLVAVEDGGAPAGRFALADRIGGARTGEVFRATDRQGGAQVVYKLVDAGITANPTVFQRVERETRQLIRAQNPRLAAVIDCGKAPDGRLFVASEFFASESLEKILKAGPMALDRAKAIVGQVGQALLEAQKAGVVHRDLSPKNILVSSSGDVKVINFAVAKPINDKASGVAAYLSPEQVQGKPVDQRSNTYSLAAVLYNMVTGEPPFQGTPESVMELHISSPPLAPSQRRPEASLSPEVDRTILKALDKNSSRRHLTLRLFLQEVEALAGAAPATASSGKEPGVGYAKTMLFAGGQAEVANMVAKAIAARGGPPASAATPAPVAAPPAAAKTPPPVVAQAPGRPVNATMAFSPPGKEAATPPPASVQAPAVGMAATMVGMAGAGPLPGSMPARSQSPSAALAEFSEPSARLTPPPVTPFPPLAAIPGAGAAPSPAPVDSGAAKDDGKGGKGAAFRETLWFKKGDVEHMIAEAKAKMGGPAKAGDVDLPSDEVRPLEDRYVDDGSVSIDDKRKFSLGAGGANAAVSKARPVTGTDRMSEAELVNEVSGAGKKKLILIGVAVVALVAIVLVVSGMRGKSAPPPVPPVTPTAAAVPAPAPPPPPPPVPAAAAAPAAPAKPEKNADPKPAAKEDRKKADRSRKASKSKSDKKKR